MLHSFNVPTEQACKSFIVPKSKPRPQHYIRFCRYNIWQWSFCFREIQFCFCPLWKISDIILWHKYVQENKFWSSYWEFELSFPYHLIPRTNDKSQYLVPRSLLSYKVFSFSGHFSSTQLVWRKCRRDGVNCYLFFLDSCTTSTCR